MGSRGTAVLFLQPRR